MRRQRIAALFELYLHAPNLARACAQHKHGGKRTATRHRCYQRRRGALPTLLRGASPAARCIACTRSCLSCERFPYYHARSRSTLRSCLLASRHSPLLGAHCTARARARRIARCLLHIAGVCYLLKGPLAAAAWRGRKRRLGLPLARRRRSGGLTRQRRNGAAQAHHWLFTRLSRLKLGIQL